MELDCDVPTTVRQVATMNDRSSPKNEVLSFRSSEQVASTAPASSNSEVVQHRASG